jgi:hypothetical protein
MSGRIAYRAHTLRRQIALCSAIPLCAAAAPGVDAGPLAALSVVLAFAMAVTFPRSRIEALCAALWLATAAPVAALLGPMLLSGSAEPILLVLLAIPAALLWYCALVAGWLALAPRIVLRAARLRVAVALPVPPEAARAALFLHPPARHDARLPPLAPASGLPASAPEADRAVVLLDAPLSQVVTTRSTQPDGAEGISTATLRLVPQAGGTLYVEEAVRDLDLTARLTLLFSDACEDRVRHRIARAAGLPDPTLAWAPMRSPLSALARLAGAVVPGPRALD